MATGEFAQRLLKNSRRTTTILYSSIIKDLSMNGLLAGLKSTLPAPPISPPREAKFL
jgi:hypothetical protein